MRWIYFLPVVLLSCTARSGVAQGTPSATSTNVVAAPTAPPVAEAPAPSAVVAPAVVMSTSGKAFQQSYDEEAVGKNDAALTTLDTLPSPQRDGYTAQLRRAWLLHKLGKSADAIAAYTKAIALEPGSIEARIGMTLPQMALRRWADVEATSREILGRDPANYTASLRLAYAVYNQGKFAESEGLYQKLLALYPSDVDVRAGLGWSMLKNRRAAEAARVFGDLLDIAPRNTLALEGQKALKATN